MVDVEALAKQIIFEENFLPESYMISDDIEGDIRPDLDKENFSDDDNVIKLLNHTPDKSYRIGDVSELVGVKIHVLRYWETEFSRYIKPQKTQGGQRLYSCKDVEYLLNIKKLLYKDRFSIAGARKKLREMHVTEEVSQISKEVLVVLKEELEELCDDISFTLDKLNDSCHFF